MKKKRISGCKKFQIDPDKQYLRRIRIYPSFLYSRLDKWLKSMSLKGWHIVHCGVFSFLFEKGDSAVKEYFTYGLSTQEGKYSIPLQYPFLEKTYAVNKKRSKINSNESKSYQIVEIDLEKIDVKRDVCYQEMIIDRNSLYTRYFVRNFFIFVAAVTLIIIVALLFK